MKLVHTQNADSQWIVTFANDELDREHSILVESGKRRQNFSPPPCLVCELPTSHAEQELAKDMNQTIASIHTECDVYIYKYLPPLA